MGGCKKVELSPQKETKLMLDLFFILHFTYLGGTHILPTSLIYRTDRDGTEVDCGEVVQAAPVVAVWVGPVEKVDCGEVVQAAPVVAAWVGPVVVWTVVRLYKLLQ